MPITNPDYSSLNHEEMAAAIGLKIKHIPLLIMSFIEESTPILEKIEDAIAQGDYAAIRASAHSIKGSAGNLKFTDLYEMAREMEFAATAGDASFAYSEYLEAIKKGIATIKL